MQSLTTDVAVIGAGTAGLSARREAARAGARTLLVEEGPHGTTCARVGCMPSKLLIAAAEAAHDVARAPRFGIEGVDGARVDGEAVLERVRRERDRFVAGVLESVDAIPKEERLSGRARFVGPTTLEVGDHARVEARAVVVATGSQPWIPDELEDLGGFLLTSDDVFELPALPASVAVMGAGVVALELGQALARLGVRTAFFSPFPEVGPFTDPELARDTREILGAELDLHLGVEYSVSAASGPGLRVAWRSSGDSGEAGFERVLAAAGRRPRLADLDLPVTGIALDDQGVPRWDPATMQCGDAPIFVAGDVDASRPFLHEASDEGSIAGRNAARHPHTERHRRRTPLSIVFCDPQLAMVGRRFEELAAQEIVIGSAGYERQGRARVLGRNAGRIRIYAARGDGRLLGGEMIGPAVEHTSHLLAWAVQSGWTAHEAYERPFYHPVVEEALRSALRDVCQELGSVCRSTPLDLEHGPGV